MKALKALTVCQGWASLIFNPACPKDIENRTWATPYRGELLIHAGKSKKQIREASEFCDRIGIKIPDLVFGAIIGAVDLVECEHASHSVWAQPDQFHWKLENPRLFETPIPCNGALSLWKPSGEVMEQVKAAGLVLPHRSIPGRNDRLFQPQVSDKEGCERITQLSLL